MTAGDVPLVLFAISGLALVFLALSDLWERVVAAYRVTLDVYNSRRPEFPSQRVAVRVDGWCASDARRRIRCVYVSRDGGTVNTSGGVGYDGYNYPEWDVVRTRKVG